MLFDDEKLVSYDVLTLDELEPAFAMTVHKSQGSEFPVVVMPVARFAPMLSTRNLLYTAVTRAKRGVVLVGLPEACRGRQEGAVAARKGRWPPERGGDSPDWLALPGLEWSGMRACSRHRAWPGLN